MDTSLFIGTHYFMFLKITISRSLIFVGSKIKYTCTWLETINCFFKIVIKLTNKALELYWPNDINDMYIVHVYGWRIFFSVRLLSVLHDQSVFHSHHTTANDLRLQRISIPVFIHYIIFLSLFFRKSQYFPFQCWVPNKGTTGTIFITSLVWHGPWLGIEPGTSRI